jgi:2-polyprenyl-6-methoxyphenol hydroxylase-like FAD-dependent oxidoreductase
MPEALTIVGGGLAGLTLAIGLRRRNVPVTVWEAGQYPRHRVCGEFISGRGLASLDRVGLLEGLRSAGTRQATNAAFFTEHAPIAVRPRPEPAMCISRFVLDQWLAGEFQRLGGDLRVGSRWTGGYSTGVLRASGRRPEPAADGWRWFGLKVHARNLQLRADLEMHVLPAGYVGLCRLPDDEVNVCGLFRSPAPVPDLAQRWPEWLAGPPGSALNTRLMDARMDPHSFCSVAGLGLHPHRATERHECSIGDALTMIPPMTGNGMSMAFESAELAVDPLERFSRGTIPWARAQQEIARTCDRLFARRLRWATWMQRALFIPLARSALILLATRSAWCWRSAFQRTR